MTVVGKLASIAPRDAGGGMSAGELARILADAAFGSFVVTVFDPSESREVTLYAGERHGRFVRAVRGPDGHVVVEADFGASVAVWQVRHDLSDRAAGRALGVSARTVRRWRDGKCRPRDVAAWNTRMWSM